MACPLYEVIALNFLHDEGLYNRARYLINRFTKQQAAEILFEELKNSEVPHQGKKYTKAGILYALRSV